MRLNHDVVLELPPLSVAEHAVDAPDGLAHLVGARALALALKDLQSVEMVERTVDHGYPPAPNYTLSEKGQRFFGPLDDLCRACDLAVRQHA